MENANLAVLSSDRALDKALPCTWFVVVLVWKSYTRMVPLCSVDGRLQEKGRLLWSLFSSLAANSRSADHLGRWMLQKLESIFESIDIARIEP